MADCPTYIELKVPFGLSFRGYRQEKDSCNVNCEPYTEYRINGYGDDWVGLPYGYSGPKSPLSVFIGILKKGRFPRYENINGMRYLMIVYENRHPVLLEKRSAPCHVVFALAETEAEKLLKEIKANESIVWEIIDKEILDIAPPTDSTKKCPITFYRNSLLPSGFESGFQKET